ncbi:bifunctional farnesyl-diphosphate farnesyltransferase/squalene synthase [Agyrium rufum]|nr:bifunctional farnesyl-diphosphate farnesyltransferase/squalene synthase [Agyrium rufum]
MPSVRSILYYVWHFDEARYIVQWKTWHEPVHARNKTKETEVQKTCFRLLDLTSRSFAAVIQELHPELLFPVTLYYCIERGLDTVEDDMTIPIEKKEPILRDFHNIIEKEGWTFNDSGPNEKDREMLVKFDNIIAEFLKLKPAYRAIIKDITDKMGNGMADYCKNAEFNANGVDTIKDYDLYCHYVAGLVGEGLTRLFVEADLGNKALLDRSYLHESMGLFLQKTNIIRDVHEDWVDKRRFYPKEIWSQYVSNFDDLFKPENIDKALDCSSHMVLDALRHVPDCLFYLAGLKEQSVFNFCAIPQTMAIATLALCFRDPRMWQRNIKITKGEACRNMSESTQNLKVVCEAFRRNLKIIAKKNTPKDPNFLRVSIAIGKVEQFIESIFPSQSPKAAIARQEARKAAEAGQKVKAEPWDQEKCNAFYKALVYIISIRANSVAVIMFAVLVGTILFSILSIGAVTWLMGAKWDVAFKELFSTPMFKPAPDEAERIISKYDGNHQDL